MADDALHQPHDKLFKTGFGDPATAAAFLSEQLPASLSSAFSWERLRPEPGSFVDSHFRSSESDLLFSAPLHQRDSLIYLLFEHQRVCDQDLALRLLRYMVRIWENFRANSPQTKKLPVILPVVLAQNAEKWELPTQFSSLLDIPEDADAETRPFVPDFAFRLIQLAELPFEQITGTASGILILRTLKAEQTAELLGDAVWDEALIERVPTGIFAMVLRYILSAGDIDKEAFSHKIQLLHSTEIQNQAMTLAQQFHQEGRQEGRLEGRLEGQMQAVIDALLARFERVPEGLREEIAKIGDSIRLQTLLREAIRCTDLESFSKAL